MPKEIREKLVQTLADRSQREDVKPCGLTWEQGLQSVPMASGRELWHMIYYNVGVIIDGTKTYTTKVEKIVIRVKKGGAYA